MSTVSRSEASSRWHVLAALAIVYLVWGSTYLGIRFAIETLPPLLMAGSRFIVAGTILLAWQWRRGVPRPTRLHWRSAVIIAALLIVAGNGGVTWAEQHVPSGLAALMIGAMPIWMVMLDWLAFGGQRPGRQMALGLIGGLAGLALLIGPAEFAGESQINAAGAGALILAEVGWATGSLYSRRAALPATPLLATGMEMLAGGVLLILLGTVLGEWSDLDPGSVSLRSTVAFIYLALIGSLVAFSAYIWLLNHTTSARAASYAYVNPVVAVVLGWALAGEDLSLRTVLAAAVIISSVVMIMSFRARPAARPGTANLPPAGGAVEASAGK
jgi:drug/metabolite transporter (DMT)-like permease